VFLEVKTENEITSGEDREDNQSEEPVRQWDIAFGTNWTTTLVTTLFVRFLAINYHVARRGEDFVQEVFFMFLPGEADQVVLHCSKSTSAHFFLSSDFSACVTFACCFYLNSFLLSERWRNQEVSYLVINIMGFTVQIR
jgi:hypothetical protein